MSKDNLFGVLFVCALLLISEVALRTRIWYYKREGKRLDRELGLLTNPSDSANEEGK